MKPKYKTFLTRKAYNDLRGIYRYIREELQNNSAAINIVDDIEERIRLLEDFPLTGNFVQDTGLLAKGYRKLIINNYIENCQQAGIYMPAGAINYSPVNSCVIAHNTIVNCGETGLFLGNTDAMPIVGHYPESDWKLKPYNNFFMNNIIRIEPVESPNIRYRIFSYLCCALEDHIPIKSGLKGALTSLPSIEEKYFLHSRILA